MIEHQMKGSPYQAKKKSMPMGSNNSKKSGGMRSSHSVNRRGVGQMMGQSKY